ncbi:MAG: radical SAM protein [Candidatus Alcyoniella australis]|nr:radical SAM protein [Candidatus Alcyoniella australis]
MSRLRVLFVRQSKPHFEVNVTHPLGPMSVAAYVREHNNAEVEIFDNRLLNLPLDELLQRVVDWRPDVLAATAMTFEAPELHRFLARARQLLPNTPQVVGGIHATNNPEAIVRGAAQGSRFEHSGARPGAADVAVIGEGEQTLSEILAAYESGRNPSDIPGTAVLRDDELLLGAPREVIADLDCMPWPAYDLIDVPRYFGKLMGDLLYNRPEQMSIQTSRGCPYGCTYCHNLFGRRFRPRSAQSALDEIQMLVQDYGVRELHIQDDVFNLDLDRAKAICRGIVERGLDLVLAFPNGVRGDRMDDELLELMWRAGTRRLSLAIETVDPQIQREIDKNLDVDMVAQYMAKAARMGMLVKGFFMLGFPGETEEQIRATIEFARRTHSHIANFSRVVPNPATELGRRVAAQRGPIDVCWEEFTYDYSSINLSAVSDERFERLMRLAYQRYMLSPRRVWGLIRLFPNKLRFFWRYAGLLIIKLFMPKAPRHKGDKGFQPIKVRY